MRDLVRKFAGTLTELNGNYDDYDTAWNWKLKTKARSYTRRQTPVSEPDDWDTYTRVKMSQREEPVRVFFNVSGKGWRDRVPELYEDPTKNKKEEEEKENETPDEEWL